MATLECNNAPAATFTNAASSQENGEPLAEEKNLNIDYSEDLWLANSEDSSSSPYASASQHHQNAKAASVAVTVTSSSGGGDSSNVAGSYHPHSWPGEESGGGTVLQPSATTFINGTAIEQNGMEFHHGGSGEGKDFAQLVPAGTYVEASSESQADKTYTAMMPAAGLGVNGEELQMQSGFTTMLNAAGQQQMVFYGSGEDVVGSTMDGSSHGIIMGGSQSALLTYTHPPQPPSGAGVERSQDGSAASGEDVPGEGTLYVAMDNGEGGQQSAGVTEGGGVVVAAGNGDTAHQQQQQFAVLSPAVLGSGDGAQVVGSTSGHQTISTLPFIHTNATAGPDSNGSGGAVYQSVTYSPYAQTASQSSEGGVVEANMASTQTMYEEDGNSNSEASYQYQEQTPGGGVAAGDGVGHSKSFVCETCHKSFATGRYLKYHRKNHCKRAGSYEGKPEPEEFDNGLDVKRFACNVCHRPFRVLKCMKVHKKKKHGILKDFTCQNCAISFDTQEELTDHDCQPKSPGAPTPMQDVSGASLSPGGLQAPPIPPPPGAFLAQRRKKKRNSKPSCDICGKLFGDRISLDIHRVKHIEEEFYPCDMCPLDIHSEESTTHLAVHFRIKFFTDDNQHILEDQKAAAEAMRSDESLVSNSPASSAAPVYDNPSSILARAAASTNIINPGVDGTFVDESGNQYSTAIKSENGEIIITPANNSTPQQPNSRTFYSEFGTPPNALKSPAVADDGIPVTKTILKAKPHMCDICNKSFTEASKLDIHYKSNHVEDRPFHCEVCEKSFFTKWKLQRHMLSHLEIKPHSCPACSKSFVERGKLEAHYRTHLGTKPYKCEYCSKAFTVKSQLTIHVRRIHSADQPFGCHICGKAFLWRSGLEKHMRKHTREKPYPCTFCSQKYSQKSNLVSHLAKVHNHQYVEPEQQSSQQQQQQLPVPVSSEEAEHSMQESEQGIPAEMKVEQEEEEEEDEEEDDEEVEEGQDLLEQQEAVEQQALPQPEGEGQTMEESSQ